MIFIYFHIWKQLNEFNEIVQALLELVSLEQTLLAC